MKTNYKIIMHVKEKYQNWNQFVDWYEIYENGESVGYICEELGEAFFKGNRYESVAENNTVNRIEILAVEQDKLVLKDFYYGKTVELEQVKMGQVKLADPEEETIYVE